LKIADDAFEDTASEVIFFSQKPVLKEVMEVVEGMAERIYGPRRKQQQSSEKRRRLKRPRGSDAGNESEQPAG
jgi:predicted site-specific integrase-resolvase